MSSYKVKLFYSYCHADESHRDSLEKWLVTMRKQNLLMDWYDRKIISGQNITKTITDESLKEVQQFYQEWQDLAAHFC